MQERGTIGVFHGESSVDIDVRGGKSESTSALRRRDRRGNISPLLVRPAYMTYRQVLLCEQVLCLTNTMADFSRHGGPAGEWVELTKTTAIPTGELGLNQTVVDLQRATNEDREKASAAYMQDPGKYIGFALYSRVLMLTV